MWNSYIDSLIPYPSRVVLPNETTLNRIERAQRLALQSGTAWCPKRALSATGLYRGAKGAPRCPRASAMARRAWSYILKEPWGPTPARRAQAELWRKAVQHTNGLLSTLVDYLIIEDIGSSVKSARILTRMADARFNDSEALLTPGTGRSLYVIHWHSLHHAKHREWMQERSRSRRWAVGNGGEWKTVEAAPGITDGARVLRLLRNTIPGRARWRPSSQRRSHQCTTCGNGEVQLVWRSPFPQEAVPSDTGIAWCHSCIRPGSSDNLWFNLPDTMLLVALRDRAAECRGPSHRMNFDHGPSVYGACLLCGYGEAGAEHSIGVWP